MKFISKQANYRVVLKHGQPAEPITGRNSVSGVYVKFENGIAKVDDPKLCEMMKNHQAFQTDFILAEDENMVDPFLSTRSNVEPEHTITEIKYSGVGKSIGAKASPFTKDQQKAISDMAQKMALEMAPKMAVELMKSLSDNKKEDKPSVSKKIDKVEKVKETETIKSDDDVNENLTTKDDLKVENKKTKITDSKENNK